MRQVGVEGERGDEAPPLTIEHERGLTLAEFYEMGPATRGFES